jgi:hypothetical protein
VGCKTTAGPTSTVTWLLLPPGHYTVCETQKPGYVTTTPPCFSFDVLPQRTTQLAFGNAVAIPTGGCCMSSGACMVLSQTMCVAQGGVYSGDYTQCDPNPCAQPQGACCYPDGHCELASASGCAAQAGVYHGSGSACEAFPCVPRVAACCLDDGSCQELTRPECEAAQGVFMQDAQSCDSHVCSPTATEHTTWGAVKSHLNR